jgi:microcystin-dependent protein
MATVTPGIVWTSGETVTPAKLNAAAAPTVVVADNEITTAKILDGAVTNSKLGADIILVPAGAVMPFARSTAPTGWLEADGSVVPNGSGTVQGVTANFAQLFAAVGTAFGAAGTLPDLRGIFVRGSGSQTIDGSAFSGTFGAKQADMFRSHTHQYNVHTSSQDRRDGSAQGATNSITNPQTTDATGGDETRPANIAMLYCIKF